MNTKTVATKPTITRLTVALAATVLAAGLAACSAEGSSGGMPPQPSVTSDTQQDGTKRHCDPLSGWERSYCR